MSQENEKAIDAAIATLPVGVSRSDMMAALSAYINSMGAVICRSEPVAHMKMAEVTWITGETFPAAVVSEEEHHASFPVYRGFDD